MSAPQAGGKARTCGPTDYCPSRGRRGPDPAWIWTRIRILDSGLGFRTLDSDSGLWILDSGLWILDSGVWALLGILGFWILGFWDSMPPGLSERGGARAPSLDFSVRELKFA